MNDRDEQLAAAKERAWRPVAALDAAHACGELDDDGWHRGMSALIVPAYLDAADVRGGSGHTGTAEDWDWSRGVIGELIDRRGTLLDIGCANGLLMESVVRWGAARGLAIEPYGLDIAPALVDVARRRLPQWADRMFVGNALGWTAPLRLDIVRTGLEYVPRPRRRELVAWLLDEVVAPGGRLIVGKYNEEVEHRAIEHDLDRWGFVVVDRVERAHRGEPRVAYRALAIAAPRLSADDPSFRALRRADLPDLQRWLAEPHVDMWWHRPLDLAGVHAEYGPRIDGSEPTHVHIIQVDGRAIGWIQWYRWADYPDHAARLGAEPGSAGVDLAIGEPDLLGHGLGPWALRAFVERVIFADPSILACIADPDPCNIRSVRAFAKAGFATVGNTHLPGEPGARLVVRLDRR